jgi:hypothetical protein
MLFGKWNKKWRKKKGNRDDYTKIDVNMGLPKANLPLIIAELTGITAYLGMISHIIFQ